MTDTELKELLLSRYNEKEIIENADNRLDATWSVYIHIVPKSVSGYKRDKYYVGITGRSPEQRWENGKGYKKIAFGIAISKYGWDNIEHYIIAEGLTKREAGLAEMSLIKTLSSNKSSYGYNRTNGGENNSGAVRSQEFKDRVREVVKERWKDAEYKAAHSGDNCLFKTHRYTFSGGDHARAKKIVLLNTREIFDSIRDAFDATGVKRSNISFCLSGKSKFAGQMNGEYLSWVYYDDYIKMSEIEIQNKISDAHSGKAPKMKDPYVCLNTRDIFYYSFQAKSFAGLVNTSTKIAECCDHKRHSAGKDKDGNGLVWVRYSEYINMSEEDINIAISGANSKKNRVKVIDSQNNYVYQSIDACTSHTGVSHGVIRESALNLHKTSKYKGRFIFYDEYIKSNDPIKGLTFID